MDSSIQNPGDCEICFVTTFLNNKTFIHLKCWILISLQRKYKQDLEAQLFSLRVKK